MIEHLTSEKLKARLPLINASAVCEQAGVDYNRFKGWKLGRVRSLSELELKRIAVVLNTIAVK